MTAPHRAAWLDLDGTHNVRDVGGLRTVDGGRTRHGVLLRGDHLENLTDEAARLLRARTGLKLVVDLRSPQEKPSEGAGRRARPARAWSTWPLPMAGHGVAPDTVVRWRALLTEDPAHSYQAVIASR